MSFLFRKETPEWQNPVVSLLTKLYRSSLTWSIHHRKVMIGVAVLTLCGTVYLVESGVIGSEFLPHLDEGAIWVRGHACPEHGPQRIDPGGEPDQDSPRLVSRRPPR